MDQFAQQAHCALMQDNGVLRAVWFKYKSNGQHNIWTTISSDNGTTWGPETRLTYQTYEGAEDPAIAGSGPILHLLWMRGGGGVLYEIYYQRSTDYGATWSPDTQFTNTSGHSTGNESPVVATSGSYVHVAWCGPLVPDGAVYMQYKRSTDMGATWGPNQVISTPTRLLGPNATIAAADSNVYVAFAVNYGSGRHGIKYTRSSDNGTTWSPETVLVSTEAVTRDLFAQGSDLHLVYDDLSTGYGITTYRRSTDCGVTWAPIIELASDTTGYEFNLQARVAASGSGVHVFWIFGDNNTPQQPQLVYARSMDMGATWEPALHLTHYSDTLLTRKSKPQIVISGAAVHVFFSDSRPTTSHDHIWYMRNLTANGVEEISGGRGPRVEVRLKTQPNPFVAFATVPGHERERFALYDVSGRKVGTYNGSRIGEGLRAGVYFLKAEGKDAKPVRIVKLR
jgi:hypothetical protein